MMLSIQPKRQFDDVFFGHSSATSSAVQSPSERKRRKTGEQQVKRYRYDVVKAFFRIFFKTDERNSVLKDAIYNLYTRKIPGEARIARNAMYRHMWKVFRDKISTTQSNYREYVKGLCLQTDRAHLNYEGFEKDVSLLRNVGVGDLFDFSLEEIWKDKGSPSFLSSEPSMPNSPNDVSSDEGEISTYLDQIEIMAKNLVSAVSDLRDRLKRKEHLSISLENE